MTQLFQRPLGFVLSPSRTGTVFLTRSLSERFPDLRCVHEPPPSRVQLILGNLRNHLGWGGPVVRWLFRRSLASRLRDGPGDRPYVEINPMLCPITDLVAELDGELSVVHMTRDPRTWVPSIETFKASGYRRHLIDFVPYAKPEPAPRPDGWSRLDPTERALWRWRYCNERILELEPHCRRYARVRYEDVFSPDPAVRSASVGRILETLGIAGDEAGAPEADHAWFDTSVRVNVTPGAPDARSERPAAPDEAALQAICGPLAAAFGYGAADAARSRTEPSRSETSRSETSGSQPSGGPPSRTQIS